jgi:sigma-E factor negative regulatory protein RseB
LIEKRRAKPGFPALAAGALSGSAAVPGASSPVNFSENYNVRKWDNQRIAGLDCQVLLLEPKDGLRYTHKLWADMQSGLLLKAQAFNEKGEVVEQIGFTQVDIGGSSEKYLARLSKRDGGRDWRIAKPQVWEASLAESGWKIEPVLPGFRKISEMKRGMGDGAEVGQVVFSDGLTSVSVFVEPTPAGAKTREGLSAQGAVNIYRRAVADHLVTVLGEAPPACVTKIARSIEFRPAQAASRRVAP